MARLQAFAREVDAFTLGLEGTRVEIMARAARQEFAKAQAQNRAILGRDPPFEQFVDGHKGAALESVQPGGTIVYLFDVGAKVLADAVDYAAVVFSQLAPIGGGPRSPRDPHPGLYAQSLMLLVNGVERPFVPGEGPIEFQAADVVTLTSLLPYSRKIEVGHMKMSVPNGVMQRTMQSVRSRFGGVLNLRFTFEHYPGHLVGRTRTGGVPKTIKDVKRASSYPTIVFSVK